MQIKMLKCEDSQTIFDDFLEDITDSDFFLDGIWMEDGGYETN